MRISLITDRRCVFWIVIWVVNFITGCVVNRVFFVFFQEVRLLLKVYWLDSKSHWQKKNKRYCNENFHFVPLQNKSCFLEVQIQLTLYASVIKKAIKKYKYAVPMRSYCFLPSTPTYVCERNLGLECQDQKNGCKIVQCTV